MTKENHRRKKQRSPRRLSIWLHLKLREHYTMWTINERELFVQCTTIGTGLWWRRAGWTNSVSSVHVNNEDYEKINFKKSRTDLRSLFVLKYTSPFSLCDSKVLKFRNQTRPLLAMCETCTIRPTLRALRFCLKPNVWAALNTDPSIDLFCPKSARSLTYQLRRAVNQQGRSFA